MRIGNGPEQNDEWSLLPTERALILSIDLPKGNGLWRNSHHFADAFGSGVEFGMAQQPTNVLTCFQDRYRQYHKAIVGVAQTSAKET
jgi:hypothetical protein